MMDNSRSILDWPTFKGRRLTSREMKSGKIITRVCDLLNDPYDPNGISRDQLWMDRKGTIYFELRYGMPPLPTENCRSELTLDAVQKLNDEALRVHDRVVRIAASGNVEAGMEPRKPYKVILERKTFPTLSV